MRLIPLKHETVTCPDENHCHADPRQDILTFQIQGHEVIVESERGSSLYSVWIDGDERGVFISAAELDVLIRKLQP